VITRPLDLASRLSPPARRFDALFYVNVGLIGLFFTLFSSRFVLSPGFVVALPVMAGAQLEEVTSTDVITVLASGQIYANPGPLDLDELGDWLKIQATKRDQPSLLVFADTKVTAEKLTSIINKARLAGFKVAIAVNGPAAK
jgi:biopolymer transport protein ExbD